MATTSETPCSRCLGNCLPNTCLPSTAKPAPGRPGPAAHNTAGLCGPGGGGPSPPPRWWTEGGAAGGGGEQTSLTSELQLPTSPTSNGGALLTDTMGLSGAKRQLPWQRPVGATFRDSPQERQDAVTLATSSLLERQVLPRCPGNCQVLRFTGIRRLIHGDLSRRITAASNSLSASLFASASLFLVLLSLCSLPPGPSRWLLLGGQVPGATGILEGTSLAAPSPLTPPNDSRSLLKSLPHPLLSPRPPQGPRRSGLPGLMSQFLLGVKVKEAEVAVGRGPWPGLEGSGHGPALKSLPPNFAGTCPPGQQPCL